MPMLHIALAALLATQSPPPAPAPTAAAEEAEETEVETPAERERREVGQGYARRLLVSMRDGRSERERALATRMPYLLGGDDQQAQWAEGGKRLRAAAAAAPADALVQLLWASTDDVGGGCAAQQCPERRMALARLQPGNGIAWVPVLGAADRAGDAASVDAALAKMAAAERFDDLFVEGVMAWRDAILRQPMTARERSVASKNALAEMPFGFSGATVTVAPQFQNLVHACDPVRHPEAAPARFENCARIGRKMRDAGSSYLIQAMGSAIVHRAGAQNADDVAARRLLDWKMHSMSTAAARFDTDPMLSNQYFDDLLATGNEVRAVELLMQRLGLPMTPPAGWRSPWEERQAQEQAEAAERGH